MSSPIKNPANDAGQINVPPVQAHTVSIEIPIPSPNPASLPDPETINRYRDAGITDIGNRLLAMAEKSQKERFDENKRKHFRIYTGQIIGSVMVICVIFTIIFFAYLQNIAGGTISLSTLIVLKTAYYFASKLKNKSLS